MDFAWNFEQAVLKICLPSGRVFFLLFIFLLFSLQTTYLFSLQVRVKSYLPIRKIKKCFSLTTHHSRTLPVEVKNRFSLHPELWSFCSLNWNWICERSHIRTMENDKKTLMLLAVIYTNCELSAWKNYSWTGFEFLEWAHNVIIMIFHKFTCIPCHLWVYYDLTIWPVLSWLDSSFGMYCNSMAEVTGSNPVQAWIFFRL